MTRSVAEAATTALFSKRRGKTAFLLMSLLVGFIIYSNFNSQRQLFSCLPKLSTETADETKYELAKSESYNFFTDIDTDTWIRYQNRARNDPTYFNKATPSAGTNQLAKWLLFNVDPIFTCPHLFRVGGRGDGPKWTCDPHRLVEKPDCLIYSIGSMGIYKFEDGIINTLKLNDPKSSSPDYLPNCEIHVFDPNPKFQRANDTITKNIHYHAIGLKSSYTPFVKNGMFPESYVFASIQEIMKQLNHEHRRIDIFKIDCERCEMTTYLDWLQPSIDIRQILIETHSIISDNPKHKFFERFFDMGFVPFSKEANTHPGAKPAGELFEWGFVKLHPNFLRRPTNLYNITFA